MLFVISLPNEYGTQVKERARLSGKSVKDIFYDIISSQFEKTPKIFGDHAQVKDEQAGLNLLLSSLEKEENYRTPTNWSREELYER